MSEHHKSYPNHQFFPKITKNLCIALLVVVFKIKNNTIVVIKKHFYLKKVSIQTGPVSIIIIVLLMSSSVCKTFHMMLQIVKITALAVLQFCFDI